MANKGVLHNLSIILVGSFNPAIVTPSWLALKGLIRESEAEPDNAEIKVIHPELSSFSLHFVEFQVAKDKFVLTCNNEADFPLVKDLASSIFTVLGETPVTGIGINHIFHFDLKNREDYLKFGNWLSPLNYWSDVLNDPKLFELKIVEPLISDRPNKNLVTIAPSDKIKPFGVRMQLNYHIEKSHVPHETIAELINGHWEKSSSKMDSIFNNIMKNFSNE